MGRRRKGAVRLRIVFGSPAKTGGFIVDGPVAWRERLPQEERKGCSALQV